MKHNKIEWGIVQANPPARHEEINIFIALCPERGKRLSN